MATAIAIDATKPAASVDAVKSDLRDNLAEAKLRLEQRRDNTGPGKITAASANVTVSYDAASEEVRIDASVPSSAGGPTGDVVWAENQSGINADGTGDDRTELQAAIDDAVARNTEVSGEYSIQGIPNNVGVRVDLGGRNYQISDELTIGSAGNIEFCNGQITADATFPTGNYLIRCTSSHSHLYFNRLTLNAAQRGGCIDLGGGGWRRPVFFQCLFRNFTTAGIKSTTSSGPTGGVELTASHCSFFEYAPYGEEPTGTDTAVKAAYTGKCIDIGTTDSKIVDNVFTRCRYAIYLNDGSGGAMIMNNHFWNGVVKRTVGTPDTYTPLERGWGIWSEPWAAQVKAVNNHFDHTKMGFNLPNTTTYGSPSASIIGNWWLVTPTYIGDERRIVLFANMSNTPIGRLQVVNADIKASGGIGYNLVHLDTTSGTFDMNDVRAQIDYNQQVFQDGEGSGTRRHHFTDFTSVSSVTVNCSAWLLGNVQKVNASVETTTTDVGVRVTRSGQSFTAHFTKTCTGRLHWFVSSETT